MSLRLRLLLSLLAIAAFGLLIVDAVSYSSLRSHLSQRVDQQVEAARIPATAELLTQTGSGSGKESRQALEQLRQRFGAGPTIRLPAPVPGGSPEPLRRGGVPAEGQPPGPPGGPPPVLQLPPGTYALLRNARGATVAKDVFSYGESGITAPVLPRQLPLSEPGGPADTFTLQSRGDASTQFRAVAFQPRPGFTAVVAVPLSDYQDTLHHVALIGAVVTAAVLIGLALLAWWLIRLGLRPLEEIGETAGRIAAGDLSQRVPVSNPRTEVGRLGLALNSMLGQIEQAFDQRQASERRMRRFLADASHELRTPLTSIRGYAELFRLGAASDRQELGKAMDRIEQESERMGVMVNDLLSLARMDEVREPVREPVDFASLVADACEDARAAAPDRVISRSSPDSVQMLGDSDQLHQLVANLLVNATGHTPAGTPIEVRLVRRGGSAVLTVRDHGPGISEDAKRQVFERFWRQSESRDRDAGGAGLGLAIVASVVEAHGGLARVENHPGGGAVFAVELPVRVEAPAR
jgi:two-component system, OmpR family, sensor kinase